MIGGDSELMTRVIVALLEDSQMSASRVAVSVKNGTIVLWGDVYSNTAHSIAEQIARRQRGVAAVINNLRILSPERARPLAL